MKNLYKIEDELYVVSNNEDISENCWIITNGKLVQVSYLLSDEVAKGFKVILTTNKLLIKDGVQAIDDEFLEWFVKNPSCEKIKIIDVRDSNVYGSYYPYKIITPKEEPKQEITIEEIEQQITLTEARGERVIKYLDKYKGQSIYNEIALAIEFGYQLKLEEDE